MQGKECRDVGGSANGNAADDEWTQCNLDWCNLPGHCKHSERLISGDVYHVDDANITASGSFDPSMGTNRARLDTPQTETLRGGWAAEYRDDVNQWIQVNLGDVMLVNGVITQGSASLNQWVTSYKFFYGKTEENWEEYRKVLTGNVDQNSYVTNVIEPPVLARFVCINPQTWSIHINMRFDVIGCSIPEEVHCKKLTDPPSGHTMISQLNGRNVGAIVEYKCLPGNSYYSGEFTKQCRTYRSWYGEWVGDDLKCAGNSVDEKGGYVGLNTMPSGVITINDSVLSSELNNTFCLETWIDITRLEQQNATVFIKVSNTFGMIISNSIDNIELLAYLTSNDTTKTHTVKLNMEFVKHSNILQITMTRDEEMVGYFLNGVKIITNVITEELGTPMDDTTKDFLVFASGDVTIYSVHLQNTSCFETETYKNAQTLKKTGCETSDKSIRLSCQGDDVLVVDTVEVGQSNNNNGINYMCRFEFNSWCNIQEVKNDNVIKDMCDKQNECTVHYDDYSILRPNDCDESHNVTAVIKYHCIRKQNIYPQNITTSQSVLSTVNDLSPYDSCAAVPSGTREIAFNLGSCFQINELIINFNISSSSRSDTIHMFDIKVHTDGEENGIDYCIKGADAQHSIPVLYECGDSVFGDRVAIVLDSDPSPDWMICNVEIYATQVSYDPATCKNSNNNQPTTDDIVTTDTGVMTTDDIVTTNTGFITTDYIVTTNTGVITTDDIVTTNTRPITTDNIVTTNTTPITTDNTVTTNTTPITTDNTVTTNTGVITTDDKVTTNTGTTKTDEIATTKTGTITTDEIVTRKTETTTTDDIVAQRNRDISTTTKTTVILTSYPKQTIQTGFKASPNTTMPKTTPLMIVFKDIAEEAEKADEYVYIKRIEYEPSEAKYAAAVAIPICVPPIIFISVVVILDLPKLIMDISQAYNLVVYGTKNKPKIGPKAPILKANEPKIENDNIKT
ncbi:unnamed protein product [Owenia fusiformis]|uniref:Uncharacterized protein n=1 Tax=Owenia fusiformis TaxID=6347 RepID=A0A8J1UM95_OWEFU|nr:unnamed protein product [Owenia fusiformis]